MGSIEIPHSLLVRIDSGLRADDIRSLVFLCEPYLGTKETSLSFSSGFELFNALKKNKRLNRDYLWELLHLIGRIDLAELVHSDRDCSCNHYQYIDPFRVMLFKLSEKLASEDLIRLRHIYGKVPSKVSIKDGTDLFTIMIQHKRLSPTDTSMLGRMMQDIARHDLAEIIDRFCKSMEKEYQKSDCNCEDDMPVPEFIFQREQQTSGLPLIIRGEVIQEPDQENIDQRDVSCAMRSVHVPCKTSSSVDDDYTPVDNYKMDTDPRGYCLILDNCHSLESANNMEENIATALETCFKRLKFKVYLESNLTDERFFKVLKEFSMVDHQSFDCFVCCIISPGRESYICGSNGQEVKLGKLTSMFRAQSCPSLSNKPKLFFVESCEYTSQQQEDVIELDSPKSDEYTPDLADFLFVHHHVINPTDDPRSMEMCFMKELTRVLNKYAEREDLMTLLLHVNEAMSTRKYIGENGNIEYRRTPAPFYTLRKKLKFF